MLGRELQLPLDRLRPPLTPTPAPQPNAQAAVSNNQRRMKQHFDRSKKVKVPNILASDWVRVRWPHCDNKLASFWSSPLQVHRQLGPATFQLSDGSRWHACCLRKVPAPSKMGVDPPAAQATPPAWHFAPAAAPVLEPSDASLRPQRVRSRPGHPQDFATDFIV